MKKFGFLILVSSLFCVVSHASEAVTLLAEPYFGYAATSSLKDHSQVNSGVSVPPVSFGARIGVVIENLIFVGPDLSFSPSATISNDLSNSLYLIDRDASSASYGLTVGALIPTTSFRVWLGVMYTTLSGSSMFGPNSFDYTYSGISEKVGVSYDFIPKRLSLNAEYFFMSFPYAKSNKTSFYDLADQYKVSGNKLVISVSAPFELTGEK